jgi:hypothetical protein
LNCNEIVGIIAESDLSSGALLVMVTPPEVNRRFVGMSPRPRPLGVCTLILAGIGFHPHTALAGPNAGGTLILHSSATASKSDARAAAFRNCRTASSGSAVFPSTRNFPCGS